MKLEDLTLFDNRRPIAASSLRLLPDSTQNETILVLDGINASLEQLARSQEQLRSFLQGKPLLQPTSILILSGAAPKSNDAIALHHRELSVREFPATQDAATLIRLLSNSSPTAGQGKEDDSERVRLSLEALSFIANVERAKQGHKLVVYLSPGWPLLARADARNQPQLFDSVLYFSDLLRQARMTLYSVDPTGVQAAPDLTLPPPTRQAIGANNEPSMEPSRPGAHYYEAFLKPPTRPADANPNDLALQVMVEQTGGLNLAGSNDLAAGILRCTADAASRYAVGYTPLSMSGPFHALTWKPAGLRTRVGFYTRQP